MEKQKNQYLVRLGNNIREMRIKNGLSQESLANISGVDRSYIGGIERGERNISILSLLKISKNLKCSIIDLVQGIEDERKRLN